MNGIAGDTKSLLSNRLLSCFLASLARIFACDVARLLGYVGHERTIEFSASAMIRHGFGMSPWAQF